MLNLHLDSDDSPALSRALASIAQRIDTHPELVIEQPGLGHPYLVLTAELTDTYGKPGMMWDARIVRIAFRSDGRIYSLDEAAGERGSSGGWMGSCIPGGRLEAFAQAWLEQTDPARVEQIALF